MWRERREMWGKEFDEKRTDEGWQYSLIYDTEHLFLDDSRLSNYSQDGLQEDTFYY